MFVSTAEMHRVRVEGARSAEVRSNDEDAAAHLAAGHFARLRVLPLHTHHHQYRRTRHEGIKQLMIRNSAVAKAGRPYCLRPKRCKCEHNFCFLT